MQIIIALIFWYALWKLVIQPVGSIIYSRKHSIERYAKRDYY